MSTIQVIGIRGTGTFYVCRALENVAFPDPYVERVGVFTETDYPQTLSEKIIKVVYSPSDYDDIIFNAIQLYRMENSDDFFISGTEHVDNQCTFREAYTMMRSNIAKLNYLFDASEASTESCLNLPLRLLIDGTPSDIASMISPFLNIDTSKINLYPLLAFKNSAQLSRANTMEALNKDGPFDYGVQ